MSKIICVDFDGTIAKTRYPYIEDIYEEPKIYIRKWRKEGHNVILWTCREGEALDIALAECVRAGLMFDAVNDNLPNPKWTNTRKVNADYYIDDHFPMPISEQWKLVHSLLRR